MTRRPPITRAIQLITGSLLLAATSAFAAGKLPSPPPDCVSMQIGTTRYVKGEVYLASHQDTTALKTYGFRNLEFVGRSLGNVKYAAVWPATVPLDQLADIVSGLEYAERRPAAPDEPLDTDEAIQTLLDQQDRAATVGYDLPVEYVPAEDDIPLTVGSSTDSDYNRRGRAAFVKSRVMPLDEWTRRHPESFAATHFGEGAPRYSRPIESEETFWFRNISPSEPPPPAPSPFSIGMNSGPSSLRPYDFGILRTYHTFKTGQTQLPIKPGITDPARNRR